MLHKDEWLSQYFEGGAYRYVPPFQNVVFPTGFIYAKIPLENRDEVQRLIVKQEFEIIEISALFEQKKTITCEDNNEIEIGFALPSDRDMVVKIARNSFASSRFAQDQNISKETAGCIKADWVSNYFNGLRGDKMIIARINGNIAGFLMLINNTTIDLIAVSPNFYCRGIASKMISFANKEIGLLKAGTQLINKASVSMYQKMGFLLKHCNFILHKHVK